MSNWIAVPALLTLLFGASAIGTATAAEVVIVRGDNPETVAVGRGGLTVLRGGGGMRAMPPVEVEETQALRIVGGRTLWIVGDNGRSVTACFLTQGMYVGQRRIRCTDR